MPRNPSLAVPASTLRRIARLAEASGQDAVFVVERGLARLERENELGPPSVAELTATLQGLQSQRTGLTHQVQMLAIELNRLERAVLLSQLTRLAAPAAP